MNSHFDKGKTMLFASPVVLGVNVPYKHKKSGQVYYLVFNNVKDKINDSLYDCCVYKDEGGTLYVRSKFDFDNKFERISHVKEN